MLRCVRAVGPLLLLCLVFAGSGCHWPGSQQPNASSTEPASESLAGPVPDFAALTEVRWHSSLVPLAPDLPTLLTRLLGAAAVEEDDGPVDDGSLVWMRDYHPMLVRRASGEMMTVAYLAENHARSTLLNRRRIGRAAHFPADQVVPLIHENGNLVTNGRQVFVSERLLEDNMVERDDPTLRAAGYRPRSSAEVIALLAAAVGRPKRDVIVVPSLPLEETQHVDVWLMFLDERTAIVPQVHEEAIERLAANDQPGADAVARFLDTQARALTARGLQIVRLPMLPPLTAITPETSEDPAGRDALFLTPANGVLVAHGGKRVAVLPEFDMTEVAPDMADLQAEYEQAWATELAALDWTVEFVDGTTLVRYLGLLRCVTAPFPARVVSSSGL